MKKILLTALGVTLISALNVNAENVKFTPLNFDDSNSISAPKPATTTSKTVAGLEAKGTDLLDPSQVAGGTKMQNAILQLDNAQVEVRNKLLNYRTNYTEIDTRYKAVKQERKLAKKQIKLAERKIKNLEKAKNKIKKNFQRNANI